MRFGFLTLCILALATTSGHAAQSPKIPALFMTSPDSASANYEDKCTLLLWYWYYSLPEFYIKCRKWAPILSRKWAPLVTTIFNLTGKHQSKYEGKRYHLLDAVSRTIYLCLRLQLQLHRSNLQLKSTLRFK
jgi:hypothetical protein